MRPIKVAGLSLVAVLAMSAVVASSAAAVEIPFDHYLCYKVVESKVVPPPVTLIDEFDEAAGIQENVQPLPATKFCTPVLEKNKEKVIFDPVIHLTRYPFTSPPMKMTVEVLNQFEQTDLTTLEPVELMVPTTKGLAGPPPPPTGEEYSYEHYKCYTLQEAPFKARKALVVDQFGKHKLKVINRQRLCNPVTKIVAEHVDPIRNRQRHLVCYGVKKKKPKNHLVLTNNQFGRDQFLLIQEEELCLPSFKKILPGA